MVYNSMCTSILADILRNRKIGIIRRKISVDISYKLGT